ncbi:peptide chain release factor 1 [Parasitella parasitica]|nr:peptide chain release factor 1 [Parasitella parasitica]
MFKRVIGQISRYSTKVTPVTLQSSRITPPLEKKLQALSQRHDSLLSQLSSNSLSPSDLTNASKELAQLTSPKALFEEWMKNRIDLAELQQLLSASQDNDDMIELAKEEYTDIMDRIQKVEKDLITELAPKDTADDASAILEIRSGAGGDEASIFSADMARMYERFAQLQRWKWEVLSKSDETGNKGLKDITVNIAGKNVFGLLKYESGVHRVQRVPATEAQGRIHTSTVTVAILAQPTEVDIQIKESDLKIDVYRASGAGGQHVNTTDSAVRMTHIPTGLVVAMQDERSQHKNKLKALKVLRAKVFEQERLKTQNERRDSRNKQIGTGDRSEKIRTYNYPQSRVTDHRINLTLYELEQIISGEALMHVIEPLQEYYLAESLLDE